MRSSSTNVPTTNRDLYCVIECDRVHKARTVVRSGDSSFDWDEIFELDLVETRIVSLLLYSWDPQYRHKLCYKGSIKLYNLTLKDPTVHSLSLKMEPKGTLYIKLRYKDISVSFQRIPCQPSSAIPNPLFGVDLESVVNRENSGLNIPLVVKKCTLEVEERGVNLVGIYRLCASAVRKKILREAFEKDSSIVDLSAEHVPDINVITSKYNIFIITKYLSLRVAIVLCPYYTITSNIISCFNKLELIKFVNHLSVIEESDKLSSIIIQ